MLGNVVIIPAERGDHHESMVRIVSALDKDVDTMVVVTTNVVLQNRILGSNNNTANKII